MDTIRTSPVVHRGFTLAEMVVSAAIMSVLAVGISSAVLVSTRAVEKQDSQVLRTLGAADVSNQMSMELVSATDIPETAANAVTISVPDRNGDDESETIRYFWSGVVGDPLYRTYNNEPQFAILNGVNIFSLNYQTVTVYQTGASSDYYLAGHNSSKDRSSYRPGNNIWVSQTFIASLPAGATGWRLSRISFYGRSYGSATGRITFELRNALSDGRPGSTLICQTTVPESQLSSTTSWHSIAFPSSVCSSGYLAPNQVVCLVIKGNVTDSCLVAYHNKNVSQANYKFGYSSNAGSSWTIKTSQALLFDAYGKVAGVAGGGGGQLRLAAVRWQLSAGSDGASQIDAGVSIPNLPEPPQ